MSVLSNPGRRLTKLMFGCGNYYWPNSRESVGVRFVEHAQKKLNARWQRLNAAKSDVAMSNDLGFVKPLTYLTNENWRALDGIKNLFEMPLQRIFVVYPEVRLQPGEHMIYPPGTQSVADRSPFLSQFFQTEENFPYTYVAFGVGTPSLRPDVLITTTYSTSSDRIVDTFLANRLPREFDDKIVATFDTVLAQLRFDSENAALAQAGR